MDKGISRFGGERLKGFKIDNKLLKALEDPLTLPSNYPKDQKQEPLEMAISIIILLLTDPITRLVDQEDTYAKIWETLVELFQKKSLINKIFLKERLFGFNISTFKTLDQNLDEFPRMTIELANSKESEALSDENQAIILLNYLIESFKEVKSTIKYGRTTITIKKGIQN